MQTVYEHLVGVGALAARFVDSFCGPEWGQLAGQWHDLGKYSPEFQEKIRAESGFDEFAESSDIARMVDHSTAGALLVEKVFGSSGGSAFVTDAIAAVIAGHHGGLPDIVGSLDQRMQAKAPQLAKALAGGPPAALLTAPRPVAPRCVRTSGGREGSLRDWELWVRFLYSALVDADSLDTEAFCNPETAAERGLHPTIEVLTSRLEAHLTSFASRPGFVADVRRKVQSAVREAATRPQGIFTLTVPTGGGKTLASLLFALRHAEAHRLDRVIVVPPFTSIIEQTAEQYRSILGEGNVIEHHSALDPAHFSRRTALAAENWDAPVIVTTAVQFFESLFANRRSRCRKVHNVARSVLILDEAQTLPPGLLAPILDVLSALVAGYGVTLVLSTATMPALGRRERFPSGLEPMTELAPAPAILAEQLRRVEVRWPVSLEEPETTESLAARVAAEARVLAITHKKADARALTEEVDRLAGQGSTFHLSGNMCPAHRAAVLEEVKAALGGPGPVRVVATQVVEAGVDLDFPVVFRALAGIDSLAQAAGRCNREGRTGRGVLEVFLPESRPPPGAPAAGAAVTREMLASSPGLDIFSPAVHEGFFRRLYATRVLDALGIQALRQERSFERVAERFRLIEAGATDVVVPWGGGATLIDDLRRSGPDRHRLRALQRFVVRITDSIFQRMSDAGAIEDVADAVKALRWSHRHLYTNRHGLVVGGVVAVDPEELVV